MARLKNAPGSSRPHSVAPAQCLALLLALTCVAPALALGSLLPDRPAWVPFGFPIPKAPADNPTSRAAATLGQHLFYDTRLSFDGEIACASCHRPELAFSDGRPRARARDARHAHGTPSLANAAYRQTLGWKNAEPRSLEAQLADPLFGREPVEHGLRGKAQALLTALRAEPRYRALFAAAFPEPTEPDTPITLRNMMRALASFERTLISGDSAYDRWLFRDDRRALNEAARRGMRLFYGARLRCGGCHRGLFIGGGGFATGADGQGRVRVPSLRDVSATAPYMHDGRFQTLEAVIEDYSAMPMASEQGRQARQRTGFTITDNEIVDVTAFLESLRGPDFSQLAHTRNPWPASAADCCTP